jgi:predicted O-methyltransferase YrrM
MFKLIYIFKIIYRFSFVVSKKVFSKSQNYLVKNKLVESFFYLRDSALQKVTIDEIIMKDNIFIDNSPIINGNLSEMESIIIARIINKYKPERVFEFGTFNGRTTLNIAKNISNAGKVFTLDLPKEIKTRTKFKTSKFERIYIYKKNIESVFLKHNEAKEKIEFLYGDSATFNYSDYLGTMDMVFIDGSHSYDYVMNDTQIALKLIKPSGGIILWHDYNSAVYSGLTRAINEMCNNYECLKQIKLIKGTSLIFVEIKMQN